MKKRSLRKQTNLFPWEKNFVHVMEGRERFCQKKREVEQPLWREKFEGRGTS